VTDYRRYAIYYTPPPGAFADFGAAWLGWDIARGAHVPTFDRPDAVTARPVRYGFHATLKPPFRLAPGATFAALDEEVARVTGRLATEQVEALTLSRLGRFLACVPADDGAALSHLAARLVRDLDGFRATPSPRELARRRASGLSPEEDANLVRWGYPYVMEAFRFHMTLTGPLDESTLNDVESRLEPVLAPILPRPFVVSNVTLAGEDEDGFFHEIHRYALSG